MTWNLCSDSYSASFQLLISSSEWDKPLTSHARVHATMPSANGPGLGKCHDVWTTVCHYLWHPQPADLQAVSVTCSPIAGVTQAIIFWSLIAGPSNSFLVTLSNTKGLDHGIPLPVLSYVHPQDSQKALNKWCNWGSAPACLHHLPIIPRLQAYNIINACSHPLACQYTPYRFHSSRAGYSHPATDTQQHCEIQQTIFHEKFQGLE